VVETAIKRLLCCKFRRTGKAIGQVYHVLVVDMSRNKCFFHVIISYVLRFMSIYSLFTDCPLHKNHRNVCINMAREDDKFTDLYEGRIRK
jgi:hypothetical protein